MFHSNASHAFGDRRHHSGRCQRLPDSNDARGDFSLDTVQGNSTARDAPVVPFDVEEDLRFQQSWQQMTALMGHTRSSVERMVALLNRVAAAGNLVPDRPLSNSHLETEACMQNWMSTPGGAQASNATAPAFEGQSFVPTSQVAADLHYVDPSRFHTEPALAGGARRQMRSMADPPQLAHEDDTPMIAQCFSQQSYNVSEPVDVAEQLQPQRFAAAAEAEAAEIRNDSSAAPCQKGKRSPTLYSSAPSRFTQPLDEEGGCQHERAEALVDSLRFPAVRIPPGPGEHAHDSGGPLHDSRNRGNAVLGELVPQMPMDENRLDFASTAVMDPAVKGRPQSNEPADPSEEDGAWPSAGSVGHYTQACKPCLFWYKGMCLKGSRCHFCHIPHNIDEVRKVRPSKATRNLLRQIQVPPKQ